MPVATVAGCTDLRCVLAAVAGAPGLAAVAGREEAAEPDLRDVVARAALRARGPLAADLGFGRIVDLEIEAPINSSYQKKE